MVGVGRAFQENFASFTLSITFAVLFVALSFSSRCVGSPIAATSHGSRESSKEGREHGSETENINLTLTYTSGKVPCFKAVCQTVF